MMKKVLFCAISLLFAVAAAETSTREDEAEKWWWHPYPHRLPWALPPRPSFWKGKHPAFPPIRMDPKVEKCLASAGEVRVCVREIYASFLTCKGVLGPDCCSAIQQFDEECERVVLSHFHNPFFNALLKQYCSDTAPSPSSA